MGLTYLHPQGEPNNGANRSIAGTNANVRVPNTFIPANSSWTGGWSVQGASGVSSVGYDGSTFRINGASLIFRGGEPGTAGNRVASGFFGDSFFRSWDGGMGGYIVWTYNAPGAPNAPSLSRSANGASLTATTGGGSGRITYYNVALNGVTGWQGNSFAFNVDPHTTYNVIARAGNEDNVSANSGTTVSTGIPLAPTSVVATQSAIREKFISLSWTAPTYTGSGEASYTITRNGTNSDGTTTFTWTITSWTTTGTTRSTVDNNGGSRMVNGNQYTYTVVQNAVASNGSPAYSSASSAVSTAVAAPGPPFAPATVTAVNSGRDITVTSSVASNGGIPIVLANANEGYFVQYQQSSNEAGPWGFINESDVFIANQWSPIIKMSNQTNRTHTYASVKPGYFYRFRVYAANSVVNNNANVKTYYPHNSGTVANFSATTTPLQILSIGKKLVISGPITNAVASGTSITFTCTNQLQRDDVVSITGVLPNNFNLTNAVVTSATPSQFTVSSTQTGTFSSSSGVARSWKTLVIARRFNSFTGWTNLTGGNTFVDGELHELGLNWPF